MSVKPLVKSSAAAPAYAWVILVAAYLASIVAPFNQFKVPPIMPVLISELKINLIQAGWLMSVIAIVGMALALPAGIVLQRIGSKAAGLVALVCMGAGAAFGALSPGFLALLGSRLLEGIGIGLIAVVAPATIAIWFPREQQGTPMGIWATYVPAGSLAVYLLAPRLVAVQGWQAAWWVGAGFALLVAVLYGALVRQPPAGSHNSVESELAPLGMALANRDIWMLAAQFACFNLALGSIATFYPTFLNQVRGYSLNQAALIASITTALVMVTAPLAGWFSDRIGSRRLIFSTPYLVIAVLLLFPFHVTGWQIIALMAIQGLVFGVIPTATFAAVADVMPKPQWVGLGLAVVTIGQYAGMLLGPVLFGKLVSALGWVNAGYLMILVCLLGYVCARLVRVR